MLTPILFNIFTDDQSIGNLTKHFLHADNLTIATQRKSFEEVEDNLNMILNNIEEYYNNNYLNTMATQITAFHLRNKDGKRKLKTNWQDTDLENIAMNLNTWGSS